jgi:hypothetical protein
MKIPKGKTAATVNSNVACSQLDQFDNGYIDGYVLGADSRPYAVFVRGSDGYMDMVSINQLTADDT